MRRLALPHLKGCLKAVGHAERDVGPSECVANPLVFGLELPTDARVVPIWANFSSLTKEGEPS